MTNKYTANQSEQFKNKIIVVTGSTQGSGAETAKLLANRGAKGIQFVEEMRKKAIKLKMKFKTLVLNVFMSKLT